MRSRVGALALVAVLLMMLVGCHTGEPKVRGVAMVASEAEEGEKTQSVDTYPSDQEELLLFGKALNFGDVDHLSVKWIYEEAGEYLIYTDTKSGHLYEFYSRINNAGNPWPTGAYRAEVYVNGQEKPSATVHFIVE